MKKRILLVGDYDRSDFLYVAKYLHKEADFFFIEYLNSNYLKNKECLEYGKVLYWKDYSDAYDLIKKIQPHKVLFYFIESYNHVALNVACKVRRIPAFHLEHGLRFSTSFIKAVNNDIILTKNKQSNFKALFNLSDFYDKYRNRRFFQNTVVKSPLKGKTFLQQYYRVRSTNTIFDTFQKLKNPLRLPDSYISFSPRIFNYHKQLEGLPDDYPVQYTGVPSFDTFFQWKHLETSGENILFIDQPFFEKGLFGWTRAYKSWFLKQLAGCISILNKKLYIKPHPWNDRSLYDELTSFKEIVIINDKWNNVIPDINIILGFSSTLLLPFIAMHHTGCIILEIYPQKNAGIYTKFLLDSKACDAVESFEELKSKMKERNVWYPEQKEAKENFIQNWMYKFDGESSDRLRTILLADESI